MLQPRIPGLQHFSCYGHNTDSFNSAAGFLFSVSSKSIHAFIEGLPTLEAIK